MKKFIAHLSPGKAAMVVGIAFITSVFIVTLVDDFLLANFVVPGDTAALARDIDANGRLFGFAVVGYLLVLALDSIIGLALYVVLKPANKNLALLTAVLRLLYACILVSGLFALVFQIIDVLRLCNYKANWIHIFCLAYLCTWLFGLQVRIYTEKPWYIVDICIVHICRIFCRSASTCNT